MKAVHIFCAVFAISAVCSVNAQEPKMPAKPAAGTSAPAMPLVDGEVRKVDLDKGLIVLRHGDIPSIAMPAMTMGFDVADKKLLDGLKVGDKVKFQAQMVNSKATVTELKPIK
jgi:Cu(I)/Ag(I) efflux system membrane protein CusA/SilA